MASQRKNNLRSGLKKRARARDPMAEFDRLPHELRCWLAQAALPWSARSALRLWQKTLQDCRGDVDAARTRLSCIERKRLCQDARDVWGEAHPSAREATPTQLYPRMQA